VSVLSVEGLAEREAARAGRAGPAAPAADAAKPKSRAHSISSHAGPMAGVPPAPVHALAPGPGADPQTYAALLAAAEKVAAETPGAPRTPWAPGPAGGAFEDGDAGPGTPGGVEAVVVYAEAGERPRARPSRAGSEDCMSTARSQILELCQFLGVEDGAGAGARSAGPGPAGGRRRAGARARGRGRARGACGGGRARPRPAAASAQAGAQGVPNRAPAGRRRGGRNGRGGRGGGRWHAGPGAAIPAADAGLPGHLLHRGAAQGARALALAPFFLCGASLSVNSATSAPSDPWGWF